MKKYLFSLIAMSVALTSFYESYAAAETQTEKKAVDDKDELDKTKGKNDVVSVADIETVTIGTETINLKEFWARLDAMINQAKGDKEFSAEKKESFCRSMLFARIAEILFCQAAKSIGLDNTPEFKEQLKMFTNQLLSKSYLQKMAIERVTQDGINKAYKEYEKAFPKDGIEIGDIVVKEKALAASIIKDVKAGKKKYAELVKQYGSALAKENNGKDSLLLPIDGLKAELRTLATKKEGDCVDAAVQQPDGYHILFLISRQQVKAQPLAEVAKMLESVVLRQEVGKIVSSLMKTANIQARNANGELVDVTKLLKQENAGHDVATQEEAPAETAAPATQEEPTSAAAEPEKQPVTEAAPVKEKTEESWWKRLFKKLFGWL